MRKGITPVLSVVLLLMMTVAAFSLTYFWISGTQEDIQKEVGATISDSLAKSQGAIKIESIFNSSGKIGVIVRNTGKSTYSNEDMSSTNIKISFYVDGIPVPATNIEFLEGGDTTLAPKSTFKIECTSTSNPSCTWPTDSEVHTIKIVMPDTISTSASCVTSGRSYC